MDGNDPGVYALSMNGKHTYLMQLGNEAPNGKIVHVHDKNTRESLQLSLLHQLNDEPSRRGTEFERLV